MNGGYEARQRKEMKKMAATLGELPAFLGKRELNITFGFVNIRFITNFTLDPLIFIWLEIIFRIRYYIGFLLLVLTYCYKEYLKKPFITVLEVRNLKSASLS